MTRPWRALDVAIIAVMLCVAGCVANPTPHPGSEDATANPTASGADSYTDPSPSPAVDAGQGPADATEPFADTGPPAEPDAGLDDGDVDAAGDASDDALGDAAAAGDASDDALGDGDVATSDTSAGPPPVYVTSWSAEESDGDGVWDPGEGIWITVVMDSDADYFNYPGVVLEDDQALVTYEDDFFVFYGIFAGEPLEALWLVTADASLATGTTVNFTASTSTLSCEDSGEECPEGTPLSFSLTLGESLP